MGMFCTLYNDKNFSNYTISPMSTLRNILSYASMVLALFVLVQCSSKNSAELVKEGIELSKKGSYDKASDAFLKATELNPKNPDAFYGLGGIYNYQNKHNEAAQTFKIVIKLDPTHFNARYSLGFTYEKLGKLEQAKKEFERYHSLKKRFETMVKKEKIKH